MFSRNSAGEFCRRREHLSRHESSFCVCGCQLLRCGWSFCSCRSHLSRCGSRFCSRRSHLSRCGSRFLHPQVPSFTPRIEVLYPQVPSFTLRDKACACAGRLCICVWAFACRAELRTGYWGTTSGGCTPQTEARAIHVMNASKSSVPPFAQPANHLRQGEEHLEDRSGSEAACQ